MYTIFKVYWFGYNIGSVYILILFDHKACEILAPQPGIKPSSPALKGEVLTPGPPGKSLGAPSFLPPDLALTLFPIICPSSADKGTDHVMGHVMDQPCQQIPSLVLIYKPASETLQPGPTWPLQCSCSQTTFSDDLLTASQGAAPGLGKHLTH